MRAERRRYGPLIVGGDGEATKHRILKAAEEAYVGNNDAAIALADRSHNPLMRPKIPDEKAANFRAENYPDSFQDDRLFWLGLAANRGDLLAKALYVNTVANAQLFRNDEVNEHVPAAQQESVMAQTKSYIYDLIIAGVGDGYSFLSAGYQEGSLGLPYDAVRAQAARIALSKIEPSSLIRAWVEQGSQRLRAGEIEAASRVSREELLAPLLH